MKTLPSLCLIFSTLIISLFLINPSVVLAQNNWQKYGSPVINLGTPNSWDDTHVVGSSTILTTDGYKMLYVGNDGSHWRLGLATSNDGINWTKYPNNPVMDRTAFGENIGEPSVIYDSNLYKIWYTSSNFLPNGVQSIDYATSADAVNWSVPLKVIFKTQPWESSGIAHPYTIKTGSSYKIYYNGNLLDIWTIGFATSTDGINWEKYIENPVFVPSAEESPTAGAPSLLQENGLFTMFYHSNHPPIKINIATSINGIDWNRNPTNPILMPTIGQFDSMQIISPDVIKDNSVLKMWYSGFDGSNWRIGYATASADIPPTPTPTPSPSPSPTPTPTPIPTTKVVVIPGFGASWNGDALLNCKSDGYQGEWIENPVATLIYKPLRDALSQNSLSPLSYFYDWRRQVPSHVPAVTKLINDNTASNERVHMVAQAWEDSSVAPI